MVGDNQWNLSLFFFLIIISDVQYLGYCNRGGLFDLTSYLDLIMSPPNHVGFNSLRIVVLF